MRSSPPLIALCLVLAACGGSGGSGSTEPPPQTLTVTLPSGSSIKSGTSVQAIAMIGTSPASNVTWSTSDTQIADVTAAGLVTGAKAGIATIRAKSGTLTGQASVLVAPGDPASIVIFSGNGQTGTRGASLPDPLCTNVLDAAGNWIIGAMVTYTVATGGGQLSTPTVATNSGGIAISGTWILGPTAGAQTVTASAAGAGSVTFTATAQ
jgi:hypothetical protein